MKKLQFSRRLIRIVFSASLRLSRNFRGRLAGLAQIAAGGRLSRRLRGLPVIDVLRCLICNFSVISVSSECLLFSSRRMSSSSERRNRQVQLQHLYELLRRMFLKVDDVFLKSINTHYLHLLSHCYQLSVKSFPATKLAVFYL